MTNDIRGKIVTTTRGDTIKITEEDGMLKLSAVLGATLTPYEVQELLEAITEVNLRRAGVRRSA